MNAFTDEQDSRVQAELRKDERLVWFGLPEPRAYVRMVRQPFWFGIAFAAFALFWIASAWAITSFAEGLEKAQDIDPVIRYFPLFGIPFLLVGLGLTTAPLWIRRRARCTCYALTDRRVVIWKPRWFGGLEVRSYSASQLTRITRREYSDGTGDLIFEEIVEQYTDENGHPCTRTIERGFKGIEVVREIERLIRSTLAPDARRLGDPWRIP